LENPTARATTSWNTARLRPQFEVFPRHRRCRVVSRKRRGVVIRDHHHHHHHHHRHLVVVVVVVVIRESTARKAIAARTHGTKRRMPETTDRAVTIRVEGGTSGKPQGFRARRERRRTEESVSLVDRKKHRAHATGTNYRRRESGERRDAVGSSRVARSVSAG